MDRTWEAILDRLDEIEQNCDPALGDARTVQFMVDCLTLIKDRLPPVSLQVLDITKSASTDEKDLQTVKDVRNRCWTFVKTAEKSSDLSNQVSAVRASIFLIDTRLHPGERDFLDSAVMFLEFVNQVESHVEEELALLRKHFSECLSFRAESRPARL